MDNRTTAVCIASKKLGQAKENVIDQLKNVDDCILSLNASKGDLDLAYLRIQRQLEAEVEFVVKALNKRKMKLLKELELEKEEKRLVIIESVQTATELSAKTKEVCS